MIGGSRGAAVRTGRLRRGGARVALLGLVAIVAAACGTGDAEPAADGPSPGASFEWPDELPRLSDLVPGEVEAIPVKPGTKHLASGRYTWVGRLPDGRAWGIADGVETLWDSGIGVIILGPEETGEAVSQLILDVSGRVARDGVTYTGVDAATLSTTARRVGTLDRGEAELFELSPLRYGPSLVRIHERGPNYVRGDTCLELEKAAALIGGLEVDDKERSITVCVQFVAVEP